MSQFTIGLDIGTTSTKAVLFGDVDGIAAQASRSVELISVAPGHAEADPEQWLSNVSASILEVTSAAGVRADQIRAIAATGMVPAVVLVDATGRPLRRAILQNDARASAEIDELRETLGGFDLVALTGSAMTQQSVAPTLAWIAKHEPSLRRDLRFVMGSYDWVLTALGAEAHVEGNWALESGLFTIAGEPLMPVFDACGFSPDEVPPVRRSATPVGTLSRTAAERTGLRPGTPLVVGGADHVLSAFGAGVERPGDCLVKLGGAGDILVASDAPIVDSRIYLDAHPVPGRWLPNGCMATSGSLIRWFQSVVGGVDLVELDDEATSCPPADVLCVPYFLGEKSPVHDPRLRGAFAGLHLGQSRAHLYRAVLEGIAFGFRHHRDVFESLGVTFDRVMVTNGGSKSTLWKQIHADVLETVLHPVVNHPGASLGAAVAAAIGVSVLPGWDSVRHYITLADPIVPDPEASAIYRDAYAEWRSLADAVAPVSHRLFDRTTAINWRS